VPPALPEKKLNLNPPSDNANQNHCCLSVLCAFAVNIYNGFYFFMLCRPDKTSITTAVTARQIPIA
jgi:hypothetical protein